MERVLSNGKFLRLWLGQAVSNSGDYVFGIAVIWYILVSTESVILVGLTVALTLVPSILVAPLAGVLVDRWNRRHVLLATYAAQATLVGGAGILYVLHELGFVFALITVVGLEVGHSFANPASGAILPRVVDKSELISANGLISGTSSFNMLTSTAVGGAVVALLGLSVPFEYDAISFVLAMAFIAGIPHAVGSPNPEEPRATMVAPSLSFTRQLADGGRYLRSDRVVLGLTVMGTLVSFFAMGLQGLYAPYVQLNLQSGPTIYGLFLASFAGGAIAGSLVIGHIGRRFRTSTLLIAGLSGQALAIITLSINRDALLALVIWGGCGVAQMVNVVPFQSLLQAKIPTSLFGRVSSMVNAIMFAPSPLAIIMTSELAVRFSIAIMFLLYGIAMLITVITVFALRQDIRKVDIKRYEGVNPSSTLR